MDNIDLLSNDYTIITWPTGKIHSKKFPYLSIRVAFGVYSLKSVPKEAADSDIDQLLNVCREATVTSGLRACLVINENKCYYFKADGKIIDNKKPPSGGSIVNWQKYVDGLIKTIDLGGDKKIFYAKDSFGKTIIVIPNA